MCWIERFQNSSSHTPFPPCSDWPMYVVSLPCVAVSIQSSGFGRLLTKRSAVSLDAFANAISPVSVHAMTAIEASARIGPATRLTCGTSATIAISASEQPSVTNSIR